MSGQGFPKSVCDGTVYEVFARHKEADPPRHVGNVVAPDTGSAAVYARSLYSEWNWIEMFVVKRGDVVRLVGPV